MTSIQIVLLVFAVLVLVGAALLAWQAMRRRNLRQTFGPEYDRVMEDSGSRVEAERELLDRERRHAELDLKPLDPSARERYVNEWQGVQAQFIADPARAVVSGDDLVTRLVAERGYPTGDYEDQVAHLSVEHARTLGHYRDAHEIYLRGQQGQATTEELRQALVHYRELFADVLGETSLGSHPDDRTGARRATS